jgi:hypothetical protein
MSTRAIYTFSDKNAEYHVYKHHDGYPSGAAQWIAAALPYAWPLPRFEADEFAASFVAANKDRCGGVRLTCGKTWKQAASADIEYRYDVTFTNGKLDVIAFAVDCDYNTGKWRENRIFGGTLEQFQAWVKKSDAA